MNTQINRSMILGSILQPGGAPVNDTDSIDRWHDLCNEVLDLPVDHTPANERLDHGQVYQSGWGLIGTEIASGMIVSGVCGERNTRIAIAPR